MSVEGDVRGVMLAGVSLEPIRSDMERILRAQVQFMPGISAGDMPARLVDHDGESWLMARVAVPGLPAAHRQRMLARSLSKELRRS